MGDALIRLRGATPPVHPRQSVSDRQGWEDINICLKGLEIRTGEIQNTLHAHVQDTDQWHQQ